MKAKLIIKKKNINGYDQSIITHIKLTDDEGKYIKFTKHTPELLQFLQNVEIDVDELDNLLI